MKAYMRRAEAFCKTNRLQEAIQDMEKALEEIKFLSTSEKQELVSLKEKYQEEMKEKERLKEMREAAGLQNNEDVDKQKEKEEGREGIAGGKGVQEVSKTVEVKQETDSCSKIQEIQEEETVAGLVQPRSESVGVKSRKETEKNMEERSQHRQFVVGEKVVFKTETSQTVEGVIAFDNEDGSYDIVCDDGSDRDRVSAARLTSICADGEGQSEGGASANEKTKGDDRKGVDEDRGFEKVVDKQLKPVDKTSMRKVVVIEDDDEDEDGEDDGKLKGSEKVLEDSNSAAKTSAKTSQRSDRADVDFKQDMFKLMKDPNLKTFVDEILSGGKVLSDEEILSKYGDRGE